MCPAIHLFQQQQRCSSQTTQIIVLAVIFTYPGKQNGIQYSTQGKEEGEKGWSNLTIAHVVQYLHFAQQNG